MLNLHKIEGSCPNLHRSSTPARRTARPAGDGVFIPAGGHLKLCTSWTCSVDFDTTFLWWFILTHGPFGFSHLNLHLSLSLQQKRTQTHKMDMCQVRGSTKMWWSERVLGTKKKIIPLATKHRPICQVPSHLFGAYNQSRPSPSPSVFTIRYWGANH